MTAPCPATRYFQLVLDRLEPWFDFESVPKDFGTTVTHWAHFTQTDEKYFLNRRINLFTVSRHQYIALAPVTTLTPSILNDAFEALKRVVIATGGNSETMSTDYTLAFIVEEPVDLACVRFLSTLRFKKSFAWGLQGWADTSVVICDVTQEDLWVSPDGKDHLTSLLWSFSEKPVAPLRQSLTARLKESLLG